jgi:hypothetical protein
MYQMKYTKNFKGTTKSMTKGSKGAKHIQFKSMTKGTTKSTKGTTQGIIIKPKKWVMERGQKVIWKRQRAQESRYKQERTLA